ncbi:MAG TPA: immunoglobulin-like domain-containing protein [Candidatus Eisenbacteria bacterium]|nr:immunoglobulin-like domain-containing protein [Candidatus Eisenbacteria bacterium]
MPRSSRLSLQLALATALFVSFATPSLAQTPTVSTDKEDYVPGEIVHISGSGWLPGETVMMILFETPENPDVRMLTAVADSSGSFTNEEFSPVERDMGVTFTLVATGQTSGWTAQTVFTDGPKVGSVSVGSPSTSQLCPGSTVTYSVTVQRGTGPGSSGNFNAALTVPSGLPAGVTASFSPGSLPFPPGQNTNGSTLTLTSTSATLKGEVSFTVRASNSAMDFAEGAGSLTVDTQAPTASAPATSTIAVGPSCQAVIPDLRSTVVRSDNCTPSGSLIVTQNPGAGTMVGLGTTVVTFTVKDALGNEASTSTSVSVVDQTPPSVALLGANPVVLEAGAAYAEPGANATDNCAGALPVSVSGAVNTSQPGSYTLTYTANDGNGNSANATRTVNVVDTTAPVMALNGGTPVTVECHTSFNDPGALATDIVDGDLSSAIQVSGSADVNTPGSYTVVYSVTDAHGNAANISRTVNVVDTTAPVMALHGESAMTVECHTSFTDAGATAADLCAGDLSAAIQAAGSVDVNTPGSYAVVYSVTDAHGNSANVSRTVNVVDTTAPVMVLHGESAMTVECHTSFTDPGATATDLCAGDLSAAIQVSGLVDVNTPGTYTLTYQVSDGINTSSIGRTVNVVDTTDPILALNGASPITVECHTSFTDPGATASDLCAGDLSGAIQVSGSVDVNTPGTYTLIYQVSDGFNTSSISRTVHVDDTTDPVLALNGTSPVTVECHTSFSDAGATASDLCAGDLSGAIQVSGLVDVNTPGAYTLIYSVNDGHGNSAALSRTVNVVDTIDPILTLIGATEVTVECHATFSDPGATASDLCAGDLSNVIQVAGLVDVNTPGRYALVYQVSDGFNSSSVSRTVNVVDTTDPVLALNGTSPVTVECHASFTDPGATASDLCAGDLSSAIQISGSVDVNTVGTYTLSYSVSDGHGNSSSMSRTVNVLDTTAPTLSVPAAIRASTGTSATVCGAVVPLASLGEASAIDACAGALSVERIGVPDGGLFPVGTTTITYKVADPSGNVATGTQSVLVVDETAPTITCPSNIVQVVDPGQCAAVVRYAITVNDNCPGATFTATPASGSSFAMGSATSVTVTATDAAGNTATCSFDVQVVNPAPVVTISSPASGSVFPVGSPVSFNGTFTDNAGDTHAAQWVLDGKTLPGVVDESAGSASLTYAFPNAGVYAVTLIVMDQCGGSGTATEVAGLTAMVVVYDPTAGFVTGGGWIQSPAGAYRPDTTMVGKANFGFVSKYKKGQTTPSGETEFQFKAGNLNFHSHGYEWLVVAGSKAQFKGWGSVNGTADYGFLLTALDGQVLNDKAVDKFRIKIWKLADGVIVYDNQFGAADSSGPSTALGGGSIQIVTNANANRASLMADPGADRSGERPSLALAPAMPNPFRFSTMLRFSLGERSRVTVTVYDAAGREVGRPLDDDVAAGSHAVRWPGKGPSPSSGVYFVRMTAMSASGQRFVKQQSLVLVR